MKPRPLCRYRLPQYPTTEQVRANPKLLAENLPAAWRYTPQLAGVVALMLAANACGGGDSRQPTPGTPTVPSPTAAIVAPIFQHGAGRGAIGCVVVSPPAFLSEEEALQVISEELNRAGLSTWEENANLEGVRVSQRMERFWQENGEWKSEFLETSSKPLNVDLVRRQDHLAIEYVSAGDYFDLGGIRSSSTAQDYDMQDVAQHVTEAVEQQGESVYFAAFYDPVVNVDLSPSSSWEQGQAKGIEEAKELLREQVRDFVEWLEGQGVL